MIAVTGLGKAYGAKVVLHGIDLQVAQGELLGLCGPNGAGKSTLLRCLVGLVQRDTGTVQIGGRDPATDPVGVRRSTIYLPGEIGVYQQMTGRQFLDFALGFHHNHHADLLDTLVQGFGLPLQQKVRSYSAGMKQKLALLAALVPDVDLYLLDEPDRALDAQVRFFLRDVLRTLHRRGKTIVLSSHHLSEVETLADRLLFLIGGNFVAEAQVQAARARLRRRPRLRLHAPVPLPTGARVLTTEPDGTLLLETEGEPLAWLAGLPTSAVAAVEIGTTRLEDLYQLLLAGPAGGGP